MGLVCTFGFKRSKEEARPGHTLRLKQFAKSIAASRRASAMPIMAAAIIPCIGALGAAVDTARIYLAKSQLQAGVDAAALAGARAYSITDNSESGRDKQVQAYFAGNFKPGFLGSTDLNLRSEFEQQNGIYVTTVTASISLPLTLMRVFRRDAEQITAVAKAELQPRPLEVMVVLDNTGSMKANLPKDSNGVVKTRMTATKDAAKSFINILYQGGETRKDLAVGFVMYDITVNVGKILTDWNPNSVVQQFAFNDSYMYSYGGRWPNNHLAWKGCVFGDETVRDLNSTRTYHEPGAWDIVRSLPGEGSHPAVRPYFIPPMYVPHLSKGSASAARMADPGSSYYQVSNVEPGYNLYRLHDTYYDAMLNPARYGFNVSYHPYRKAFYEYFIGLNDNDANKGNDVITRVDGSFYNPATDSWNFTTNSGTPFLINYDRVPNLSLWKPATEYSVDPDGGSVNSGSLNQTVQPSPNWQCPEASVPVAYGRSKSYYINDVIEKANGAIYPANGTLHHAGLLWGYRLLVRDDVFKRQNPTNERAKRALIFMTDGETALGTSQNGYTDRTFTFYGNYADAPISTSPGNLTSQSERRFDKTCAALQAEENPPTVYIVALTTTASGTLNMFERCAPGRVYRTSDTAQLNAAFSDIAAELVDLHLVQ